MSSNSWTCSSTPPGARGSAMTVPGDLNGRLLRGPIGVVPRLLGDFLLRDDALHEPAAVPNDRKLQLPRGALVVQPAVDRDLLANVLR